MMGRIGWMGMCLVLGCGGGAEPVDGGTDRDAPLVDTGTADVPATVDAGPFEESATISITGAQTTTLTFGASNYISCVSDPSGFFSVTATQAPSILDGFNFSFRAYDGAGTYETMYSASGSAPSASVRLAGGYEYWMSFNRSNVDLSAERLARCTLVVTEVGLDAIEARFTCTDYVSNILSPDYDDRDAAGFRPWVDFTANVRCSI